MNKIIPIAVIFFFISGPFAATVSPVSASKLVEDSWNTKTPMSQARVNFGVVAVNGKIYVIGGNTENGLQGINEQYNPKTDTWVTLEPMPTPRGSFAIATFQDKIYCIGGETFNEQEKATCGLNEVYDTVTDSWSVKAPLSFDGLHLQACVVNGKIFVITKRYSDVPGLFMYDPIADLWTNKTSAPVPLVFSCSVGNKIISVGNFPIEHIEPELSYEQKVLFYNPETDVWSEGKTLSTPIQGNVAVGVTSGVYAPQKIYVLGSNYNIAYDPISDTWLTAKTMPTTRNDFGVVVVDDVLYAIGGRAPLSGYFVLLPTSLNEQYVPIGYSYTPIDPKPSDSLTTFKPEPFKYPSVYIIVALLIILIVTVTASLFFYFKRKTTKIS